MYIVLIYFKVYEKVNCPKDLRNTFETVFPLARPEKLHFES